MKLRQIQLEENKEQRVQTRRAKLNNCFNWLFSSARSLVDPQNLLNYSSLPPKYAHV
jgi:hypothetical protein